MLEHITISEEDCIGCELCVSLCPASPCVFEMEDITAKIIHPEACEECMLCVENCPTNAITLSRSDD